MAPWAIPITETPECVAMRAALRGCLPDPDDAEYVASRANRAVAAASNRALERAALLAEQRGQDGLASEILALRVDEP